MKTYLKGQQIRVSGSFTSGGSAVDPTTVRFLLRKVGTTTATVYVYNTDAELVRDSEGEYHIDLALDDPGKWYYYWDADGTGKSAYETWFSVEKSRVA